MTFRDLQETVARLADDPRIHPTTRIEVAWQAKDYTDIWIERKPLRHIAFQEHALVFAATCEEPALAR